MHIFRLYFIPVLAAFLLLPGCNSKPDHKITIYTIGDSTVKNGQGDGAGGLWGWGDPFQLYFDTSKVKVKNFARGGTSSRTFRTLGLWQDVYDQLREGDYVIMQFGHNDSGPLNDSLRARGTIRGVGDESEVIDNILTGERETVHTYGWYLTQTIREVKEKGAIPVVVSPIPRNRWENGQVPRNDASYGGWARLVAEREGVCFINLNEKMSDAMEELGEEKVTGHLFYLHDHTHTTAEGAVLAASLVAKGLRGLPECNLHRYLLKNPIINFPAKKKVLLIGDSTVANGRDSIAGWGLFLPDFFDSARIEVVNRARGGRSSRTFYSEGLWNESLELLNREDVLLIQFGHNDGGPIDQPKYRGSIRGTGDETMEVLVEDGTVETVYTYGWYLRKFIEEASAQGVDVVVLSHIPRNRWIDGRIERNNKDYGLWTREVAEETGVYFVDLNELIAKAYEEMGENAVSRLFPADHTHTNEEGAYLNAQILAGSLTARGFPLQGTRRIVHP